jgi:hypothetical protein
VSATDVTGFTLTFTAAEVATLPSESVTLAVSATTPAAVGVHDTE